MHGTGRWALLAGWLSIAGPACADDGGDGSGETASPGVPGTASLLGTLDPNLFCDMPSVVTVQVFATRVGCDPESTAPCTLPADPEPVAGDMRACPITDPEIVLGVDVTSAGRYQLEAVGAQTAGGQTARCFAVDANVQLDVLEADLQAAAQIYATLTDSPCPTGR